jgi:hypothetical protein
MPTWIGEVVKGLAHHLEWTGDIHEVHLIMEGDENLDRLSIAGILDCTHCDGIV